MPLQVSGRGTFTAPWVAIYVFAALAAAAAIAAMAIPGPASDLSGIAAIVWLGSTAIVAGHRWGVIVAAAGNVLIIGKLLPIIATGSVPTAAGIAVMLAIPGLAVFALIVPTTADVVVGASTARGRRMAEAGVALTGLISLLLPAVA